MRTAGIKTWLLVGMLAGFAVIAFGADDHTVSADMRGGVRASVSPESVESDDWSVDAEVEFSEPVPFLTVRGRVETSLPIEDRSFLSYNIFDESGDLILREGRRSAWQRTTDGGLAAEYEIEIPEVLNRPDLLGVSIRFDAVVEHEYWYRSQFPEISFPELRITNLPKRDHYETGWVWVPRYLPAGFGAKIPASFTVRFRDLELSQFVPALDVNSIDGLTRVPSRRIELIEPIETSFRGWMPLDAQEVGTVMVRPGLVWEDVRWYTAAGWFERQPVTFVSPLLYALLVLIGIVGLWCSWRWMGRIKHRNLRRLATVAAVLLAGWFALHLMVSGFWLLAVSYVAIAICARGSIRVGTYGATWICFVFTELYWSQLQAGVAMASGGVWLSSAVWALLLLPLLAIPRARIGYSIALAVSLIWTVATFSSVIYFEFFQDYPSIENLVYAGQVGELGDSVFSLIEGHHLLPFFVWISGAVIYAAVRRQRKTQIEKT